MIPSRSKLLRGLDSLGAAPLLAAIASVGLLMVALGNDAARDSKSGAETLFWAGLIVIYAPIALRLLSASASRNERIALVVLLGGALFGVKLLYNPIDFVLHDEFATWRQTHDLMATGQPLTDNPVVSGYAGFPSLSMFTSALVELTGMRVFVAAQIIILLARLALMLGLFVLLERITFSTRAAGIGVALYACNPSFLYFDSQFAYESLVLCIAAALLVVTLRWTGNPTRVKPGDVRGLVAGMAILAATIVVTHHMTSYALIGFLALWTLMIALFVPRGPVKRRHLWRRRVLGPGLPLAMLALGAGAWFAFVAGDVTTDELGDVIKEAITSAGNLLTGESSGKTLFASGEQTNTMLARLIAIGAVLPLLAIIPIGLWKTRRSVESNQLWRALAIVAAFYPLTLFLRLTAAGTETSQRASEFVYLGLAFVAAILVMELPASRKRLGTVASTVGLMLLGTLIFLGSFIVGESPATRQPGPFLVAGESRSISQQGRAAAAFAALHLEPDSRFIADRPNANLLGSFGGLERVVGTVNGRRVVRVFFSPRYDGIDQAIVSDNKIDYIVVDRRLSRGTPVNGFYFEGSEPQANTYEEPISDGALTKFKNVKGMSRIFDNGAIAIYDASGTRSP